MKNKYEVKLAIEATILLEIEATTLQEAIKIGPELLTEQFCQDNLNINKEEILSGRKVNANE